MGIQYVKYILNTGRTKGGVKMKIKLSRVTQYPGGLVRENQSLWEGRKKRRWCAF